MKVVIGNKVFDSCIEPIVVKLSDRDKQCIAKMPDDHIYFIAKPKGTPPEIIDKLCEKVGWRKDKTK